VHPDALRADLLAWQVLPIKNCGFVNARLHELHHCPRCGSSLMQRIEIVLSHYLDRAAA
jgi:predicted Zn-ribbon and HTH transcriptional regulator